MTTFYYYYIPLRGVYALRYLSLCILGYIYLPKRGGLSPDYQHFKCPKIPINTKLVGTMSVHSRGAFALPSMHCGGVCGDNALIIGTLLPIFTHVLTLNAFIMPENVLGVCKKLAKNGIETTITFKSDSVCLVSLSKNGAKAEQLTAVSHRGVPKCINDLAGKLYIPHHDPDVEAAFPG